MKSGKALEPAQRVLGLECLRVQLERNGRAVNTCAAAAGLLRAFHEQVLAKHSRDRGCRIAEVGEGSICTSIILAAGLTLDTAVTREFAHIPSLRVE